MSLFDYDQDLKKQEENRKTENLNTHLDKLKNEGMSDYAIDRQREMIVNAPEKLKRYEPADVNIMHEVAFYFNPDDYRKFKEFFKIYKDESVD